MPSVTSRVCVDQKHEDCVMLHCACNCHVDLVEPLQQSLKLPKEEVNHPSHYGGKDNPYEAIKIIEAHKLGFNLGNTVKYILRCELKGAPIKDLEKARFYLDREIKNRRKAAS